MCVQCYLTTIPPGVKSTVLTSDHVLTFFSLVIFVEMSYIGNMNLVGALRCDLRLHQSVESVGSRFNV